MSGVSGQVGLYCPKSPCDWDRKVFDQCRLSVVRRFLSHQSQRCVQMYETHRPWWSVADAARVLRVHRDTLYDACSSGSFPHERWGGSIRIPCEALRMTYVPEPAIQTLMRQRPETLGDPDQLALPLDPVCLVPVRRYRNTREVIGTVSP